jgi:hypothetical protein
MSHAAVDDFLAALEAGSRPPESCYADQAVFDATVPGWRFSVHGPAGIADWYHDHHFLPGRFEHIRREPTTTGELVEYSLVWEGRGGTHAVHHCHLLDVQDGRITTDMMFCGGQWGPEALAEMAASR